MLSQLRIYTLRSKCIYSGRSGHPPPPLPSSIPPALQRLALPQRKAAFLRGDTKQFYPQSRDRGAPRLLSSHCWDFLARFQLIIRSEQPPIS